MSSIQQLRNDLEEQAKQLESEYKELQQRIIESNLQLELKKSDVASQVAAELEGSKGVVQEISIPAVETPSVTTSDIEKALKHLLKI